MTITAARMAAFLLDDPDAVVVVLEGRIDVFAVARADASGTPAEPRSGPRRHLWTAEPGAALFGFDLAGAGTSLVAIPAADACVRRARLGELDAHARTPEGTLEIAALIDSFLAGLGAAIGKRDMPAMHASLAPDHAEDLRAGQRVGAAREPVWVRVERGSAVFAGNDQIRLDASSPACPIATGAWLEAREALRVVASGTASLLERDAADLWRGVQLARATFLRWLEARLAADDAAEIAQLRRKAEHEAVGRDRAFATLAGVGTSGEGEAALEGDALAVALRALGRAARIDFRPAPRWEGSARQADPLGAICRASGVRQREVGLRGSWWRSDAGPLLAFTKGSRVPVALLPLRRGGYEYVHGETRRRHPVTAGIMEELEPVAIAFQGASPARPLRTGDLLRVAFAGLHREAGMVAAMALGAAALGLLVPVAIAFLFGSVIPSADVGDVLALMFALIAVHVGQALFEVARVFALQRIETKSQGALQAALTDRLLSLPAPFFRQYTVGDLASRIGGISAVRDLFNGVAINAVLGGTFAFVYLALLFAYSPMLALVALGLVSLSALVTILCGVRLVAVRRAEQDVAGRIAGLVFQLITGIAKLRVSGAEGRGFAQWGARFAEQKRLAVKAGLLQNLVALYDALVPLASAAILYAFAGRGLGAGRGALALTTPEFLAFSAAFGTLMRAGSTLSGTVVQLLTAVPLVERARPILAVGPERAASHPDPGELTGRIEVAHLSFRYAPDGPLVLDDVSIGMAPGEFVALVGPSGSGKSTLLRLLLGFETPEAGAVLYDGQDLSTVDVTAVRAQLGVVLQHGRILAGDIYRNVVGSAPLTTEDAWEAVTAAGLEEDVRAMPMGLHTVMSEGGSTLSGGQRQRLLIARAIVQRPRVVLLDEATSALDNRTQSLVTQSLARIRATRVVVAHRLSTIRDADRIYVLDGGRVVEAGRFEELMARHGLFERLARRQVV